MAKTCIDIAEACERSGLKRDELIELCFKYSVPMFKKWGTSTIERVQWSGPLAYICFEKTYGAPPVRPRGRDAMDM